MRELNIEYSTFKTVMSKYNIPIYYVDDTIGYVLYMSATNFIYISEVRSSEDKLDFENTYKSSSVQASSSDDAMALAVVPYKWSDSTCLVAQKSFYVDGNQIEIITNNSEGNCTWQYDKDIELQGVDVIVNGDGAKFGDKAVFTIVHPVYGEVNRFGNDVRIVGKNIYTVLPSIVAPLPAGLIIKCTYIAADTNGREIAVNLRSYK